MVQIGQDRSRLVQICSGGSEKISTCRSSFSTIKDPLADEIRQKNGFLRAVWNWGIGNHGPAAPRDSMRNGLGIEVIVIQGAKT